MLVLSEPLEAGLRQRWSGLQAGRRQAQQFAERPLVDLAIQRIQAPVCFLRATGYTPGGNRGFQAGHRVRREVDGAAPGGVAAINENYPFEEDQ